MENLTAERIYINAEDYWEDVVELAFVLPGDTFISIARIPYENQIYAEFGDQTNFCYAERAVYNTDGDMISFDFDGFKSSGTLRRSFTIRTDRITDMPSNFNQALSGLFKGLPPPVN